MLIMKKIVRFLLVLSGLLISGELFACKIELPQYLCWEYWEEYSAEGITKTNPAESDYFPIKGGATVKHTFLLYNSTNPDGAYNHKLMVAPNNLDIVSVVSQPAFDVPYQETEYAVIEYTAPMSIGTYDITIHILNENGERVSSEKGLTSQIEVTSLPASLPPDDPNPYPDYDPPWAEVTGIESSYAVGDNVSYTATAADNGNLLSWLDFLVIDANGNQLYAKFWDNIHLDSFQEFDSFPTTDWAEGTYYYELRVKDVAGNEVLAQDSSFQLASLTPNKPLEQQICGSVEPVKLSSSQLLEQDGNILINGTIITVLNDLGNVTEIQVNKTGETGYVATTNLSEVCDVPTPLEALNQPKSGEVVVSTPMGIYAHRYPNVGSDYVDVNGDGTGNKTDIIPYNTPLNVQRVWQNWVKVSFEDTHGQTKEGWIYRGFLAEAPDIPQTAETRTAKQTGVIAWAHNMTVDLRMYPEKDINEIIWESYEDTSVQVVEQSHPFYFVKIEMPSRNLDDNTTQQYGRLYEGNVDLNQLQIGLSGWVHQELIKVDGQTYNTPFAYPFNYETAKSAPIAEQGLVNLIFFEEIFGEPLHYGVDYNLDEGTSVQAANEGELVSAEKRDDGLGNTVVIKHAEDRYSVYAHLKDIREDLPQPIPKGIEIGTSGGTAPWDGGSKRPHLHFGIRTDSNLDGDWQKWLNPTKYIDIATYNPSDAHQCVKGLIVDEGIRDANEIALRCDVGIGAQIAATITATNLAGKCTSYSFTGNFNDYTCLPGNCFKNVDGEIEKVFLRDIPELSNLLDNTDFNLSDLANIQAGIVFEDVMASQQEHYCSDIGYAKDSGWIDGSEKTFRPDDALTRAEALKIIIEAAIDAGFIAQEDIDNYVQYGPSIDGTSLCFPDIESGHWSEKYACYAKNKGIVEGKDGKFKGNDYVTNNELLKMSMETLGFWVDDLTEATKKALSLFGFKNVENDSGWAKPYLDMAKCRGIDTTQKDANTVSRAFGVHLIKNVFDAKAEGDLNSCNVTKEKYSCGYIAKNDLGSTSKVIVNDENYGTVDIDFQWNERSEGDMKDGDIGYVHKALREDVLKKLDSDESCPDKHAYAKMIKANVEILPILSLGVESEITLFTQTVVEGFAIKKCAYNNTDCRIWIVDYTIPYKIRPNKSPIWSDANENFSSIYNPHNSKAYLFTKSALDKYLKAAGPCGNIGLPIDDNNLIVGKDDAYELLFFENGVFQNNTWLFADKIDSYESFAERNDSVSKELMSFIGDKVAAKKYIKVQNIHKPEKGVKCVSVLTAENRTTNVCQVGNEPFDIQKANDQIPENEFNILKFVSGNKFTESELVTSNWAGTGEEENNILLDPRYCSETYWKNASKVENTDNILKIQALACYNRAIQAFETEADFVLKEKNKDSWGEILKKSRFLLNTAVLVGYSSMKIEGTLASIGRQSLLAKQAKTAKTVWTGVKAAAATSGVGIIAVAGSTIAEIILIEQAKNFWYEVFDCTDFKGKTQKYCKNYFGIIDTWHAPDFVKEMVLGNVINKYHTPTDKIMLMGLEIGPSVVAFTGFIKVDGEIVSARRAFEDGEDVTKITTDGFDKKTDSTLNSKVETEIDAVKGEKGAGHLTNQEGIQRAVENSGNVIVDKLGEKEFEKLANFARTLRKAGEEDALKILTKALQQMDGVSADDVKNLERFVNFLDTIKNSETKRRIFFDILGVANNPTHTWEIFKGLPEEKQAEIWDITYNPKTSSDSGILANNFLEKLDELERGDEAKRAFDTQSRLHFIYVNGNLGIKWRPEAHHLLPLKFRKNPTPSQKELMEQLDELFCPSGKGEYCSGGKFDVNLAENTFILPNGLHGPNRYADLTPPNPMPAYNQIVEYRLKQAIKSGTTEQKKRNFFLELKDMRNDLIDKTDDFHIREPWRDSELVNFIKQHRNFYDAM
jgi:hypothetical protein